jgi:hypothetical protein
MGAGRVALVLGARRGYGDDVLQLAFVTMGADAQPLTASALADAWRRTWPHEAPLEELEDDDGTLSCAFMDALGMIGYMPGPIPWSDLEGPASCAWHWPEATSVLEAHRAHFIVTVRGEETSPKLQAIRLTLLTAAVCAAAPSATAVYWASGTAVTPADRFVGLAQEMTPDSLPTLAWIEFRVFPNEGRSRWSVFTTGLEALGLMEVEVRNAKGEPSDLVDKVMNVAGYLLDAGLVLKDGDTIGNGADEKLRVHHVRSAWERDSTVLWIEM